MYQLLRTNAAVGELVEHTRTLHGEQLAPVAMINLRVLGKDAVDRNAQRTPFPTNQNGRRSFAAGAAARAASVRL